MFIMPFGVFCYNIMPSVLKNTDSTYQRCMQACLKEQIGRKIQVYVDDIVIKTREAKMLIDDLRETFDNLDHYKIKMNPGKCTFGLPSGNYSTTSSPNGGSRRIRSKSGPYWPWRSRRTS